MALKPKLTLSQASVCLSLRVPDWRKILGPYRKCAGVLKPGRPRACPAGAFAIGRFGGSRWRLRRTRGAILNMYGDSMAVSPFHRLGLTSCRVSLRKEVLPQQHLSTRHRKNLASKETSAPRTRGSVRRASGFVQIRITLIDTARSACFCSKNTGNFCQH